ncbi:MAG: hypothetical protein PHX62_03275 [Bacilli bacterium]|nr:hypothetical protein [Bacilli bacterium]
MFPDYVMKYKQKGYKILKRGEQYYLYKTSSKRVEGFKYPQTSNIYIGIITEDGLIKAKTRIEEITGYEYGLCSYLLNINKNLFTGYGDKVIVKAILITIYGIKITKYHFKRSYLSIIYPDVIIDHVMDVDRKLARLIASYVDYNNYNQLLGVYAVLISNRWYLTNLDDSVIEIFQKYNIKWEI